MAFDLGFNCRATSGFVTDGSEGVPTLGEAYPHTYTNGNGYSVNAGWVTGPDLTNNEANTNDPRIAGGNFYENTGTPHFFKIDLSSGSAPGAGNYTLDLAVGAATSNRHADFKVLDDSTVLIDGTNGGAGFATAPGHFIDASLADVAATTTWTGTTVSKTFATTTAQFGCNYDNLSNFTVLAHFRLTLQGGASTIRPHHIAYGLQRGIFLGR